MSAPDQDYGSPRDFHVANGPPYPPRNQGLGGSPDTIPDIPISAVLLVLYLIFGIIHIKILKSNKTRGHKFIFNGAVLGLCKVRLITMSLRMAWASYPRNAGLAIAANVFVYVGTIILFMINWFFVQRIVRAQHTRLGWSTPYRIFHRGALVVLILCLIMLILGNIWQSFTLDDVKLRACRVLILIGQTYFTVFCFAPAVVTAISLLIPRHEIDKFGAGRLRNNIMILLIAVTVLFAGQLFRCVIQWIPQTPLRDETGRPLETPWFLSKAAFYCFNFVTEIIVVILYAVVRVDLRFHVPDGSRMSGDYSLRSSRVSVNNLSSNKNLAAEGPNIPRIYSHNDSSETLHKYDHSIFADSNTLADSLQYTGSTLEVDCKTGNWKVKRVSTSSRYSQSSLHSSQSSHQSMYDRAVRFEDESEVPPVPTIPNDPKWPLTDAATKRASGTVNTEDRSLPVSRDKDQSFELADQALNHVDMNDAISDALSKLEENSEYNKQLAVARDSAKATPLPPSPPPGYETVGRTSSGAGAPLADREQSDKKIPALRNPLAPRKRATFPPKSALKTSKPASGSTTPRVTHTIKEAPEVPDVPVPPLVANKQTGPRRPSSVEIISITRKPSIDSRQILDMSLQGDKAVDISRPSSPVHAVTTEHETPGKDADVEGGVSRETSSKYSQTTTSSEAREAATAVEEFNRFSYDGAGVSPIEDEVKQ